MSSSYLRVVTLYIHPTVELTLLQPCFVRIKLFLALSYRQELISYLYDASPAAMNPRKPDRAGLRPSILNLNALGVLILNATGLSLTCELPQLFLGHQVL
jgi:hypothetical protein